MGHIATIDTREARGGTLWQRSAAPQTDQLEGFGGSARPPNKGKACSAVGCKLQQLWVSTGVASSAVVEACMQAHAG